MAVRKYINVATTKFTATASGACTISHFRIASSGATTVRTKFKALAGGSQTLASGQRMEIADQAFYIEAPTASDLTDARNIAIFDAEFLDTDIIQWSEDGTNVSSNLAATDVTDWDNAAVV